MMSMTTLFVLSLSTNVNVKIIYFSVLNTDWLRVHGKSQS